MFWMLIFIISGLLLGMQLRKYTKEYYNTEPYNRYYIKLSSFGTAYIAISIISMVIILLQGFVGIYEYPKLTEQISHVEALQSRTQDIREAYYEHKEDGNLIAGSVENMTQSTNLSKYISDLAIKEANYKGRLQKVKTHKETFPLYFFGYGWAISNKIYDLPITIESR